MNKISVMIVEDHELTRGGLQMVIAQEPDMEVIGAYANSDEGLQHAQNKRPEVILLDLHLPGASGPVTMVKSFCNIPGVKVIVFSVENRPAYIDTIMQLGPAGYLLKSESTVTVIDTIRRVVSDVKKAITSKELSSAPAKLTPSEQEVLRMLAKGMKYQTIAESRHTSPETIRKQCEMLVLKLGLETREELIAWAAKNGYDAIDR
jgi:DNA-binding NarL/FixJ family response regulator